MALILWSHLISHFSINCPQTWQHFPHETLQFVEFYTYIVIKVIIKRSKTLNNICVKDNIKQKYKLDKSWMNTILSFAPGLFFYQPVSNSPLHLRYKSLNNFTQNFGKPQLSVHLNYSQYYKLDLMNLTYFSGFSDKQRDGERESYTNYKIYGKLTVLKRK